MSASVTTLSPQPDNEILKRIFSGFRKTLNRAPKQRWPIRSHSFAPYIYEDFINDIIGDYMELERNNISMEKIISAFRNPKRIWRIYHHIAFSLDSSKAPAELQRDIILFFYRIILGMKSSDPFNSDNTNLWYKPTQVNEIVEKLDYHLIASDSKYIHTLIGILWSYCESLFFAFHGAGFEIHGPYALQNSSSDSLMIRTYFDLSPSLWPELIRSQYETIEISVLYNHNVKVIFSEYGTIIKQKGNFKDNTIGYYIICNGGPVEIAELENLISHFKDRLNYINDIISGWSKEELVKRYIDIFWYQKKPMKDLLKKDWKPAKEVYEKAMNKLNSINLQKRIDSKKCDAILNRLLKSQNGGSR
jgi:hypothetical protein